MTQGGTVTGVSRAGCRSADRGIARGHRPRRSPTLNAAGP